MTKRLLAILLLVVAAVAGTAADLTPTPNALIGFGGKVAINSDGSIQLQTATGQPIQAYGSSAGFYSGPVVFGSLISPAVSAASQANLYFDGTTLKLSTNGGGYITLGGGADLHSPGAIGDATPGTGTFSSLTIPASSYGAQLLSIDGGSILVFGGQGAIRANQYQSGNADCNYDGNLTLASSYSIRFAAGAHYYNSAADVILARTGVGILAVRTASAEQTLIVGPSSTGIRSNGGELEAFDNAGNVTVISPHAHDAPAWLYESGPGADNMERKINVFRAEVRWKNVDRLQRVLELDATARLDAVNAQAAWDEVFDRQRTNRFKTTTVETFAAYETRTGTSLVPSDQAHDAWFAMTPAQRWQKVEADRVSKSQAEHDAWAGRKTAAGANPFTEPEPAIYQAQPAPAFLAAP